MVKTRRATRQESIPRSNRQTFTRATQIDFDRKILQFFGILKLYADRDYRRGLPAGIDRETVSIDDFSARIVFENTLHAVDPPCCCWSRLATVNTEPPRRIVGAVSIFIIVIKGYILCDF